MLYAVSSNRQPLTMLFERPSKAKLSEVLTLEALQKDWVTVQGDAPFTCHKASASTSALEPKSLSVALLIRTKIAFSCIAAN